jgi:hypothetical protein
MFSFTVKTYCIDARTRLSIRMSSTPIPDILADMCISPEEAETKAQQTDVEQATAAFLQISKILMQNGATKTNIKLLDIKANRVDKVMNLLTKWFEIKGWCVTLNRACGWLCLQPTEGSVQ